MMGETGPAFLRRRKRELAIAGAILAAALYFAGLLHNPPGFYIDESSISYNAYTIAQTGRDEHGTPWPLYFRAFGDYKNPVYVYLLAGLFKLTGPGIPVARALSAAAGLAAALLLGLLAARSAGRRDVGLLVAASALLTPWLFETSRMVMEVALYPLALTLFLLCLHRVAYKAKWSPLDVAGLAATLALLTYAYSIGRLLAPLLAGGLIIFFTRERWPGVVRTWGAYGLTLIPLFLFNRQHEGALTARFNLITYITPQSSYGEIATAFLKRYIGNLNPWRLLVAGDPNPDQVAHIFGTEHLLAATAVCAVGGGWLALRHHGRDAWWRYIFYGLAVSLIPAALTKEYVHMLRLVPLPVFLLVLSVPAFVWLREEAARRRGRRIALALLLIFTLAQGAFFQWRFHHSVATPRRLHLFDAGCPQHIFAPAVASSAHPIYIADAPWIPGYIQAYWYATLRGVELARFIRLAPTAQPPQGALVISTEEHCLGCQVIAERAPYMLYLTTAPPRPPLAPLPAGGFRAALEALDAPARLRAGSRETILVRVRNTSAVVWPARARSGEEYQISLGNRWLDANGQTVANDDGRNTLLRDVNPGAEIELSLTINTPTRAGAYVLELDMLQEGVSWFWARGSPPQRLRVSIE